MRMCLLGNQGLIKMRMSLYKEILYLRRLLREVAVSTVNFVITGESSLWDVREDDRYIGREFCSIRRFFTPAGG